MENHLESIQLLNTAIIKSKEKKINTSYEERLNELCNSSAIDALNQAIDILSKKENESGYIKVIMCVFSVKFYVYFLYLNLNFFPPN